MQLLNTNISISYGGKIVFQDTDLIINESVKYGIVGKNGIGKTTILRIIHEKIPEISVFLDQNQVDNFGTDSVFDTVISINTMRKYYLDKLSTVDDSDFDMYNEVVEKAEEYASDESTVSKILHGLGFNKDMQKAPVNSFSGGWRMRIMLAKALYMNPPVLLLDEPTNHLDLEGVIWLQKWLSNKYMGTLLVVSHSPSFLDNVCTTIIGIRKYKICYYKGGYTTYKKLLSQKMESDKKNWEKLERQVKELKNKSTPKKKVDEFIKSQNNLGITRPEKEYAPNFVIPTVPEISGNFVELDEVSFGYDDKLLLSDVTLGIDCNTRLAIVGYNGCGKSTLLGLINGLLVPKNGTVKRDYQLRTHYLTQHPVLPDELTCLEFIENLGVVNIELQHKLCGMFGIDNRKAKIGDLSGGQRVRLSFIELYIKKPHLILLDEPTNHLDIESIDSLVSSINSTNAAIVIITHEPKLIEDTCCKIMHLSDGELYETTYDEYIDYVMDMID